MTRTGPAAPSAPRTRSRVDPGARGPVTTVLQGKRSDRCYVHWPDGTRYTAPGGAPLLPGLRGVCRADGTTAHRGWPWTWIALLACDRRPGAARASTVGASGQQPASPPPSRPRRRRREGAHGDVADRAAGPPARGGRLARPNALGTANAGRWRAACACPPRGPATTPTTRPLSSRPAAPTGRGAPRPPSARLLTSPAGGRRAHPNAPRLGIGDIAQERGGPFTGPVVGHASHENGLGAGRAADPSRRLGGVDPSTYDRALTQAARSPDRRRARPTSSSARTSTSTAPVMVWPDHDDHIHADSPTRTAPATRRVGRRPGRHRAPGQFSATRRRRRALRGPRGDVGHRRPHPPARSRLLAGATCTWASA